ncbi:MAG: hypothetical protein AB7P33_09845 [Dehalococcoidia bacterium]
MSGVAVEVQIKGLKELEAKLGGSVLYEDETEAGLDTIEKRMLRGGKGLGAKRNTVSSERLVLSRRVQSTDNWPRVTGRSWRDKQVALFKAMSPRVARSIIKKINQRWAAAGAP